MRRLIRLFDSIFPVREESAGNALATWLDRTIYFFITLTAVAAPVSIAATNAGWIGGVFFWLIRSFVTPRPKFFRTPIDLPILLFFGWSLLSCAFSYAPDLSFDRLRVLTLFPIAYLVAQNIRQLKTVKFLAGALIFAAMISALWTFTDRAVGRGVQVFGVAPDGVLWRAGIRDGDALLKINGKKFSQPETLVDALSSGEKIKVNIYRPDYYMDVEIFERFSATATMEAKSALGFAEWSASRNWRAAGFFGHYTTYAEILQLVMSLAFGLFIALPIKKSKFGAILFACLILLGVALLMTATRASQAAFLLSAFLIVALGANRKILFALLALALPLAVGAAIYLQQSRGTGFVDAADNSTAWRLTVWREGFDLLTQSPRHLLVGVGIDSVKRYKCDWGLFDDCRLPAGHFHSTPLQIAAETGLPALLFWLFFAWRYAAALWAGIRKSGGAAKGVLLGAFGGFAGFLASGAVHYNLGDSEAAMVFFFVAGLALVLVERSAEKYPNLRG